MTADCGLYVYGASIFKDIAYFHMQDAGRLGMNTVGILIAFSYSTGMAPISGKYGVIWGIIAGMMHFAIVTLIPLQYDFFNFYNGGFTAGVVAFVLVPFIEHYWPDKAKA